MAQNSLANFMKYWNLRWDFMSLENFVELVYFMIVESFLVEVF